MNPETTPCSSRLSIILAAVFAVLVLILAILI